MARLQTVARDRQTDREGGRRERESEMVYELRHKDTLPRHDQNLCTSDNFIYIYIYI